MKTGSTVTFGNKMWLDVHKRNNIVGINNIGNLSLKIDKLVHNVQFQILVPRQAMQYKQKRNSERVSCMYIVFLPYLVSFMITK